MSFQRVKKTNAIFIVISPYRRCVQQLFPFNIDGLQTKTHEAQREQNKNKNFSHRHAHGKASTLGRNLNEKPHRQAGGERGSRSPRPKAVTAAAIPVRRINKRTADAGVYSVYIEFMRASLLAKAYVTFHYNGRRVPNGKTA